MPGIKTSAITYRRGISNSTPNFFLVAQANYVIPQPINKFRQNNVTPIAPPPPTTPGAPTITSITPSDQSLLLNFTAPTSDGGSSITDYEYSTNGTTYTSAGITSSPITISGLINGTTYPLTLRAVNSIGIGAVSNTLSGTPVTPTTFTFTSGSDIISYDTILTQSSYNSQLSTLLSVTIGTSCTAIGDNCFNLFNILPPNLASVTFLGNSVTTIGNYSFAYNNALSTITLPTSSVTSIGEFCFLYCESLNGTITIPNSVTSLGPHCFQSCQILDTIIFQSGSTITSLPFACFNGCAQLTSINIPSTVTSVGAFCFQSCSSLTIGSITYDTPSSVTSIGGSCFNYCTGLDNLPFVPSSVTSFGTNCFANCTGLGGAGTIQIPSSIQNLGDSCFLNCTNIISIVIPSSVTDLQGEMMKGCTSLSQFRFNNQSTLVLLGSDILIGLTQPITISFFNVQPSGVYADLLPIIKAYFVDPPPTGPPPASNWTYFITASLPP